jgi:hypothetical protein
MKLNDLKKKQTTFLVNFNQGRITYIENLLQEFYIQFPRNRIANISIDQYVYGRHGIDHIETFSYWMGKKLASFGRIAGSPASQYGLWYGTHGKDKNVRYRHTARYGSTIDNAFRKIKQEVAALIVHGAAQDYDAIAKSMLGEKLKGKILATYFPNIYLSIYASVYLDDILKYFNLDDLKSHKEVAIYKQQRLLHFKNTDSVMVDWTLMKFAMFLNDELYNNYYPGSATGEADDRVPMFPDISLVEAEILDQQIDESADTSSVNNGTSIPISVGKVDYLKRSKKNKAIGDRGEQIVYFSEIKTLTALGRSDLAAKVKWVAEKEDGLGYDVLSRNLDGSKRHIEVKANTKIAGHADFFLTAPELKKTGRLENYYIYYVYDVISKTPKIWQIENPFHPVKKGVRLVPSVYNVRIYKI